MDSIKTQIFAPKSIYTANLSYVQEYTFWCNDCTCVLNFHFNILFQYRTIFTFKICYNNYLKTSDAVCCVFLYVRVYLLHNILE